MRVLCKVCQGRREVKEYVVDSTSDIYFMGTVRSKEIQLSTIKKQCEECSGLGYISPQNGDHLPAYQKRFGGCVIKHIRYPYYVNDSFLYREREGDIVLKHNEEVGFYYLLSDTLGPGDIKLIE